MERHRFRVFENKLLMRISGPKREEVRGGQGKLLNEELNNLHSPRIIISHDIKEDKRGEIRSKHRGNKKYMQTEM
jgi:hypothetical protein